MTREIPLTQGYVTLVDDEDFDDLSRYRWAALKAGSKVYARRTIGNRRDGYRTVLMHHQITDLKRVDHMDGDGLNNQRSNLREASQAQNMRNRRGHGRSRFVGVRLQRRTGRWEAYIKTDGRYKQLGTFDSEEDAARARDRAAYGRDPEFAYLNFPEEWR